MQPAKVTTALPRRKRKRPVSAKTPSDGHWSSEAEEDRAPARRKAKKLQASEPVELKAESPADATREAEEPTGAERPFRGKCLYQSRKCENERALKRNGKAHNLCDEHRSKQNQHQRKFDAKKYSRRKPDGSSGDEEEHENDSGQDTRGEATTGARSASRSKASASTDGNEEVERPEHVKPPRRLETKSMSEGVATAIIRHSVHASESFPPPYFHGSAHLDPRRPPPLQMARDELVQHPQHFSNSDLSAARILAPPHGGFRPNAYVSPRGAVTPFAFLPRPSMRSQSFDSGITRISPVGGAVLGVGGLRPFDRQQQFLHDPHQHNHQHQHQHQHHPTPSLVRSPGVTSPKLPSLQQLPLTQPTYAASRVAGLSGHALHHSPAESQQQYRQSPLYYASQRDSSHHGMVQQPPHSATTRAPLLPPLAPLLHPPHQSHSPSGYQAYRPPHESRAYEDNNQ